MLALALLDEVGQLRGQQMRRHVGQSGASLRSWVGMWNRLLSMQLSTNTARPLPRRGSLRRGCDVIGDGCRVVANKGNVAESPHRPPG